VCGVLRDDAGGLFTLPPGVKWHMFIEVPHSASWRSKLNDPVPAAESAKHFLSIVCDVIDASDHTCIDSGLNGYALVPDEKMSIVAKYIKAYYNTVTMTTYVGETFELQDINRLITDDDIEQQLANDAESPLVFEPCANTDEILGMYEQLLTDAELVNPGAVKFKRKQQFCFFVSLLYRRFKIFSAQT
jgi:hypothetical protein